MRADARLRPHLTLLPAIAAGGALGALARWGLSELVPVSDGFPWPTFIANVVGCLLIGILMTAMLTVWRGTHFRRPFVGVGLLGGFTTFSAYAAETRDLMAAGETATSVLYAAGSVGAGIMAVAVGLSLGRTLWGRGVA